MLNCTKYISVQSAHVNFVFELFFAFCHLNSKPSDPVNAHSLAMTHKLTVYQEIILFSSPTVIAASLILTARMARTLTMLK